MTSLLPTLWHLPVSHFSEKARWALDHKSVSYLRRAPLPGLHAAAAHWLTRGETRTLPILRIEGRTVAGSSAIIGALEDRFDRLPLYPDDAQSRSRALAIEAHFDDRVGPAVRSLVFHELSKEPTRLADFATASAPWPLSRLGRATIPYARGVLALRYDASRHSVTAAGRARTVVHEAFDLIDDELGDGRYLADDRFSVADLTAAALLYPIVRPAEGPFGPDLGRPAGIDGLRSELRESRAYRWVETIYAEHRLARRVA